jgi:DnaJ-class molecular chaperone
MASWFVLFLLHLISLLLFLLFVDQNLDQIAEAKKWFLEIRAAYEVLSDPRERSWYDAHRDVMLKKGSGDDYEDDTINVYPFFYIFLLSRI